LPTLEIGSPPTVGGMRVSHPVPAGRPRLNLRSPLTIAAAVGGALAVALVVASLASSHKGSSSSPTTQLNGVAATAGLLRGIPQKGFVLGSSSAPATIEEFADIQCPYCARWATQVLPLVVRGYVRTGKARVVFRPLAFVGPDSQRGAEYFAAAAARGRAWQLIELAYANQGQENGGWASAEFLDRLSGAAGLDVGATRSAAAGSAATKAIRAAADEATTLGVRGTPTIFVRDRAGKLVQVANPFDLAQLNGALDAAQR
jgi:protein-disulfide isomerase